jgi:hypothetical protein
MNIVEIKQKILSWDARLSPRMKKYLHYRSFRNFINSFDSFDNSNVKDKVQVLLSGYVEDVEANDFFFERNESWELAIKYLSTLSGYYRENLKFMSMLSLSTSLLYGIMIDSLLLISGLLKKIHYLPIVTSLFALYFCYVYFFKARKGLVYGIFY